MKITSIITDLDGCLWRGTLAEKESLKLNKDYYEELKKLYKKGIQLFVVSKNDKSDVLKEFCKFGINKSIFTQIIANWEPKYLNIEKLLYQTKMRPETMVFIDDNPLELNEVNLKIESIICIDFGNWDSYLKNEYFSKLEDQPSSEIQERINRYKTAIISKKIIKTLEEDKTFLKLLKRKIAIGEITERADIERFAKLLVVTHRINFNPGRFPDYHKALSFLQNRDTNLYKIIGVSVWESDLSLGLSGGFVVRLDGNQAFIEDATFSCGIIGRDFEQKAIYELIESLKKIGIEKLFISVRKTSTNLRVTKILNELEFRNRAYTDNIELFSLSINPYNPLEKYDWIELIETPSFTEHLGIPTVASFFEENIVPLIGMNYSIVNLGSAKGEVLGHLQPKKKEEFCKFIKQNKIQLKKIDLEYIPEEENIIGDAEDLSERVSDNSSDLVLAIELLEHTQHFWKVIDEMIRICKIGGYIFISVPCFNYPKHEYPIDLWRIGPETLLSFFPDESFNVINMLKEGDKKRPRRVILLLKKVKECKILHDLPLNGNTDWKTGITYFN